MRKIYFILFATLLFASSHAQETEEKSIFNQFNDFLHEEVIFGLVDYQKIQANPSKLNSLVSSIGNYNVSGHSQNHKTAFYINAYNILVIKQIADNYPIKSPMDVKGFFKKTSFVVAGETLTLDEIEFEKLFEPTKDPRIHFALGCGARSCPFLYDNAFYPDKLLEQLDYRAQLIIDRPDYVYVDNKSESVTLNKIFNWYQDQFSMNAGSVIKYVNKYKSYKVPENYRVTFQEYDWALNDR